MAIQFRRGAFVDFIKSKMVAGEPAVVQSGDTSTQNGKAFYICYTPGSVDRVLTEQDKTALDSQISDIEDDLAAAEKVIESVQQSIPAVDATLTTTGAAADAKKTGDEISDLKSDLNTIEQSIFSSVPQTTDFPLNEVFTNVFSGYSVDSVTSNTLLTLHPNTNYKTYYLKFTKTYNVWFETIPSVSYIAIAKIDNAGNIYDDSSSGNIVKVVNGSNAVRYRKSENNLPSSNNKLTISSGTLAVVTIPSGTDAENVVINIEDPNQQPGEFDYTLLNNDIKLNSNQLSQIKKSNYVQYINGAGDDSSTERLNIYLATFNGYILFQFVHTVSASINSNIWRLGYAKQVDDSFEDVATITTTGEWECALKISGRSDFAGGFLHGDEIMQSITFLINGKVKTISELSGKVQFDKLQIVQKSNLYDPNDSTTVFAVHTSLHEFTDKLRIKQSVVFSGAYTMDVSYLSMYPISKTYSANYYTDQNYEYQAVSIPVFQRSAREVSLFGGGIASTFALKEQTENLNSGGLSILDNGGNPYNKCYFGLCGSNTAVSSGDIWKATTEYAISA